MPSSPDYDRDYKQEAKTAKSRGENGKGGTNNKRKRARYAALKLGLVKKGQDWAHKKALSEGGSNKLSNGMAQAPSKNRSFKRKSDGSMA